jgi:hypothetical protein
MRSAQGKPTTCACKASAAERPPERTRRLRLRPRWPTHEGAVHELPPADPSLLPAMREQAGAVGRQFVDVFVGFRLRFHDEREAFAFSQHFRFASPRSALRQEGAGVVWVGFHGWAFDAGDAQMQAALAVRHSAIRAKVRHIPAATDAELRPTGRRVLQPGKARRERDELLAKIDEAMPHMMDTRRTALGGASPTQRQIGDGTARSGAAAPGAATPPPPGARPHATSKAPPGFDPADGTTAKPKRRRLGR